VWSNRWNYWQGKQNYSEKPCSPQIPHNLTRARTWAVAVGSRRLTAVTAINTLSNNQRKWYMLTKVTQPLTKHDLFSVGTDFRSLVMKVTWDICRHTSCSLCLNESVSGYDVRPKFTCFETTASSVACATFHRPVGHYGSNWKMFLESMYSMQIKPRLSEIRTFLRAKLPDTARQFFAMTAGPKEA
jgi:hypothetical protein